MGYLKNILITGANGFLGSHILKKLLLDEYCPILVLRETSNTWRISDLLPRCKIYFSGSEGLTRIFDENEIHGIIHTATDYGRGTSLASLLRTNVVFPTELVELGIKSGIRLFVNTDSFFAKPHYDQSYLNRYTESKRILEKLLVELAKEARIINFRIEHVFGAKDSEHKFVTSIIKSLLMNESEIQLTSGVQKRDFIYVEDVASAYIQILNSKQESTGYAEMGVGYGNSIAVREFVEKIRAITNSGSALKFGALPDRPGEIPDSYANIHYLEELGWEPKYSLDEAIEEAVTIEKERFNI